MSSRARLILLSGDGGAGTSTLCVATVEALQDEGFGTVLVDASRGVVPDDDQVLALVTGSLGRAFLEIGADAVLPVAWTSLAGIRQLAALAQVVDLLAQDGVDAVVVDCGDLQRARELIELPAILLRLLDATITPRLAMLRAAEPSSSGSLFEALSLARTEVRRIQDTLTHSATTLRLVTLARPEAVVRTARALSTFALMGIGVEGIIANRYPRASEGWAQVHLDRHAESLRQLESLADGVAVWKSTAKLRVAPKGSSVVGPIGAVRVLDAGQLTVEAGEENFTLDLPLPGAARADATVGTHEGHLVVAFDDLTRWIQLPPVLHRCIAEYAVRTDEGLRITFVPDPALWRQAEEEQAS